MTNERHDERVARLREFIAEQHALGTSDATLIDHMTELASLRAKEPRPEAADADESQYAFRLILTGTGETAITPEGRPLRFERLLLANCGYPVVVRIRDRLYGPIVRSIELPAAGDVEAIAEDDSRIGSHWTVQVEPSGSATTASRVLVKGIAKHAAGTAH